MSRPEEQLAFDEADAEPTPHSEGAPMYASPRERERLTAMFEAHYDLVWRVLRRVGLAPAAADDGAQQVFVIAARRLPTIVAGKERAFLCATAVRVGNRLRAGHAREHLAEDELPEVAHEVTPEEALEHKRRRALLDRILAEMDEDLRAVLILTEIEGLSKREVAEALSIPEGTAASRLRRAREDFQARLKRAGGPES